MHPIELPAAAEGRFHWQDLVMAAGIVVAASLLLFPAIHGSRVQARLLACQGNLRELGTALTNYSEYHGGVFPKVPTEGNLAAASAYAPILVADKLLPEDRLVLCPGSPLADLGSFYVPSLDEIEAVAGRGVEVGVRGERDVGQDLALELADEGADEVGQVALDRE